MDYGNWSSQLKETSLMKRIFKIFSVIVILSVIFSPFFQILAESSNKIEVHLEVEGVCNNNGTCDTGENETNCSSDCGCNNNGICQLARGETTANCSSDCGCNNNGICENLRGESADNCSDCRMEGGGGGGPSDLIAPTIYNISVKDITLISVLIQWDVSENALCQFFWGDTIDYEKEIISERDFSPGRRSLSLKNLFPGTAYHFKIRCQDRASNFSETTDRSFSTAALPDTTPPSNILNFEAIPGNKEIKLQWKNPADLDFKGVRILRSEKFYPSNPFEGALVYDGTSAFFNDTGLENGKRYYYTAFSYDSSRNYSSGAITTAVPQSPGLPPIEPPPIIPPVVPPEIVPPEVREIGIKDFDFFQGGKKISFSEKEKSLTLEIKDPVTVSIKYEKVPEVLKTIMVTLNKEEKVFSFLLRVNKDKSAYEATIMAPDPGVYPLVISILDYKNQNLKELFGELIVTGVVIPAEFTGSPSRKIIYISKKCLYFLVLPIIFIILAIIIWKKRAKKEEEKK